jgi:biopolymer transport protein ExbD
MGTGGTLIRLIDVVFILLFGFISISEISQKSKIELPKSSETPPSNPDKDDVIFLGIDASGTYLVDGEALRLAGADDLLHYLQARIQDANNRAELFRVRIRSNWDTPVKYTMAAADICDHLNIPKGIDVRKVAATNSAQLQ